MKIFILWIFVCFFQISCIFSQVFVVKNPTKGTLECISEDDGNALVWNVYLGRNLSDSSNKNGAIDCDGSECLKKWVAVDKDDWKEANSLEKPMAPVFDSQWEGLREYLWFDQKSPIVLAGNLPSKLEIFISIRTSKMNEFKLCSQQTGSCIGILIKTDRLEKEVEIIYSAEKSNQQRIYSTFTYNNNLLSFDEWKTYMISYDSALGILLFSSVSDTFDKIIDIFDARLKLANSTSLQLHFEGSYRTKARIRLHQYKYVYTDTTEKLLKSPEFTLGNDKKLIVRMSIAVCEECQVMILLERGNRSHPMNIVAGSKENMIQGFPMWQQVTINRDILDYNGEKLHLIIQSNHLFDNRSDEIWTLGTVQQYETLDEMKRIKGSIFWETTCQKFSNRGSTIVRSSLPVTFNEELRINFESCPNDKMGPQCMIDCTELGSKNCEGRIICQEKGCTCAPGFTGDNCQKRCEKRYGYGCLEKCGFCDGKCKIRTGICKGGCKNIDNIYIPPYCKKAIDKIPEFDITATFNSVKTKIKIPDDWKNLNLSFTCYVKELEGNLRIHNKTGTQRITENIVELEIEEDGLQVGLNHSIFCEVVKDAARIRGEEKIFQTDCLEFPFEIYPSANSAELTYHKGFQVEHACPFKNDYTYTLKKSTVDALGKSWSTVDEQKVKSISTIFSKLDEKLEYRIDVRKGTKSLINRVFGTSKRVNSEIRNLRVFKESTTGASLEWQAPVDLKGPVTRYKIDLKPLLHQGCSKAQNVFDTKWASTNETFIKFERLHPYVLYEVTVQACNTDCGAVVQHIFKTLPKALPTTPFRDLRFNQISNELIWKKPKCTSMTGPVEAAFLILEGVSVQERLEIHLTGKNYIYNLDSVVHGAEMYQVRLYPKRDSSTAYNQSVFTSLTFTTIPKAPPAVVDLELWEFDNKRKIVNLRWKPPKRSEGELDGYSVEVKYNNIFLIKPEITYVPHAPCYLWPEFICTSVDIINFGDEITVKAKNKYVTEMGPGVTKTITQKDFEQRDSTPPRNVKTESWNSGLTQVSWSLPDKTYTPIKEFIIKVDSITTSPSIPLTYTIPARTKSGEYRTRYQTNLTLLNSTSYDITMYAKHESGFISSPLLLWIMGLS